MTGARAAAVLLGVAAPLGLVALAAACGARSGLFLDGSELVSNDAAIGSGPTVIPGLDAQPRDVVPLAICADASDTLIYTVTEQNTLLRFDPSSSQFTTIGTLNCPDPFGREPFSMAVDRQGNAYVLYFNPLNPQEPGSIFKADLTSAACAATIYVPGQGGFNGFGMGFAANDVGTGETLYLANDSTPGQLGAVNETTLTLSVVGTFPSFVLEAELTGTGDGRLFAFYNPTFDGGANTGGSAIGQIDKTTSAVVGEAVLPEVTQGGGWAFAFWGGDFYLFTAPESAGTIVQRYSPVDGSVVTVASYPEIIDGAGVSTCAPVQ